MEVFILAKFVTLERKHVWYGVVAAVLLIGMGLISSAIATQAVNTSGGAKADLKIVSVDFDPQTVEKNLVYGETKLDKVKLMGATSFKVSAVVQNVTDKKMTNIPVSLTIKLPGDPDNEQVKQGNIPSLEPGASARVTFENLKALGDAEGADLEKGQHELIMHFGANAEGGLSKATEVKVNFLVDTAQQ
jgi:preprotein translocase subunit SecF